MTQSNASAARRINPDPNAAERKYPNEELRKKGGE